MADPHRCDWGGFPSSLDETWTCPDCDVKWSAFDGKTLTRCAMDCADPTHGNHIGWTTAAMSNG